MSTLLSSARATLFGFVGVAAGLALGVMTGVLPLPDSAPPAACVRALDKYEAFVAAVTAEHGQLRTATGHAQESGDIARFGHEMTAALSAFDASITRIGSPRADDAACRGLGR